MRQVLLNVGCGTTVHADWINLDLVAAAPGVVECDLRRGIPLPDSHCHAVYHSHVLEHLDPDDAQALVRECFRVTRPGGILRVAVPDLERIARDYLVAMEAAASGRGDFAHRWMLLEMFDQCVRTTPGGRMAEAIRGASNEEFGLIRSRIGAEAVAIREPVARARAGNSRSLRRLARAAVGRARRGVLEIAARLLGGAALAAAVREGLFRQSGQLHRCMYDRVLLSSLLIRNGYSDPRQVTANESDIAGFADFGLETVNGQERKPDSLYMEAKRLAH